MSFGSSVAVCRPVTTVTTPTTSTPKLVYPPVNTMTSPRCCENGRPIMVDPITGNTICSCQIKTGVPAYLSRVPSLPETVYGSGTGHVFQPNVVIGNDVSSAFYPMGIKPDRQSESTKTSSPSGHSPYYIDHLMAAHPYNAFYPGFDLNSARRKNATRETTGALKAWLYEHRKNPYPTKGEKIMLAIITRMTLTQVSTWFANARRRLKKENKLEGRDDSLDDIDLDDKTEGGSESSRLSMSEDEDKHRVNTDLSDISDTDEPEVTYKPKTYAQRLFSPDQRSDSTTEILVPTPETKYNSDKHNQFYTNVQKMKGTQHVDLKEETNTCKDIVRPRDQNTVSQGTQNSRPKIWSISEIISKNAS